MDEIVCANTAFRYWRCPLQVREPYPRLPNSEDGWRALSQAPFVQPQGPNYYLDGARWR